MDKNNDNYFNLSPNIVLEKLRSLYTSEELEKIKEKNLEERKKLLEKLRLREKEFINKNN